MNTLPDFHPGESAARAHRALKQSVAVLDRAQKCAVLWFGEIQRRKLYRKLGYSSMRAYAIESLGFSPTRAGDFIQLAGKLEKLPEVKKAVASGRLGYTKARAIVTVADPRNEKEWIAAAGQQSRRRLVATVRQARRAAIVAAESDPAQGSLIPPPVRSTPPAAPRIRVAFDLSAEEFARYVALLAKIGSRAAKPALLLEMAGALAAEKAGAENTRRRVGAAVDAGAENTRRRVNPRAGDKPENENTRRRAESQENEKANPADRPSAPPFHIHVHECPKCARATVSTPRGTLELAPAQAEAARCDALVSEPGKRTTSAIPPRIRNEVLTRDRHRCRIKGCGHTRFLHIHHIVPRARGGTHDPSNLITLCSACHQLWHEKGGTMESMLE